MRLSHEFPYEPDWVRAVTLVEAGGELWLDFVAYVRVGGVAVSESERLAGVDPGIIHVFAVATGDQALLVSAVRCVPRSSSTSQTQRAVAE